MAASNPVKLSIPSDEYVLYAPVFLSQRSQRYPGHSKSRSLVHGGIDCLQVGHECFQILLLFQTIPSLDCYNIHIREKN